MPHIATQQASISALDTTVPTTADQLDRITNQIDRLRADLSIVIRRMPRRELPSAAAVDGGATYVFDMAAAVDHLRQAAVALDRAADQLDTKQAQATAVDAADAAWADPRWQVDSTTRTCCRGIGDHTQECTAQPVAYVLTDAAAVALN